MSEERALRSRLRTLATLHEAVGALRSLSAHHFRAARAALPAARGYRDAVEGTLGVLRDAPAAATAAAPGLIVVGADLGLCGDYSARIAAEAAAARREIGPGRVYCVGRRIQRPLENAGIALDRRYPAPVSAAGLAPVLIPLVNDVVADRRNGMVGDVVLVSARFAGAGRFSPVRSRILPVAAPPGAVTLAPSPYVRPAHLAAVLMREFLYVSLFESLLDALAAEHGKRLMSAESAWSWLGKRIAATASRLGALRRETTTQEVLEVASGARRLRAAAQRGVLRCRV